jgi:membrane fusion protein (multidrug efflux system)
MANRIFILIAVCAFSRPAPRAQNPALAKVISRPASRTIDLPAEIAPYLAATIDAKVPGYVEQMLVDRGDVVKEGQLLVTLTAPEMQARIAQAQAQLEAAKAEESQAEAQLAAQQSTFEKLRQAAQTPGAVAGNDMIQNEKQLEALRSLAASRQQAAQAAQAAVDAEKSLVAYLKITAPFDGVITTRLAHPGALAGPPGNAPLLILEQIQHLRVVAPVPEEDVGEIARGATVEFTVPAYPRRVFLGKIARIAHSLDAKTRTMPVELDVINHDVALAPGMYPTVRWPVRGTKPVLFVPKTSIVTTTERTFVIRVRGGRAEWVDVRPGAGEGSLVEVNGALREGDQVLWRATDETRDGSPYPAAGR